MLPVIVQVPPDRTRLPGMEGSPDPVDRFAEWMSQALGTAVPVLRTFLPEAPLDAFLIAFNHGLGEKMDACTPEQHRQIARRTILLEPPCPDVAGYLESLELAAALQLHVSKPWAQATREALGGMIYGRCSAAERAGIPCQRPGITRSSHYGFFYCDEKNPSLPDLLARYLTAYAALGLPLSR